MTNLLCDGKDTTITATIVGVSIPVLVKFNDHVFSGTVPLDGNLVVVNGNNKR